ncbi:hypothetical protein PCK2_000704 [Pneumocystis canis]|nr:hypothetical protein PCK2_000704 [Pneumocystis canis]
MGPYVVSHHLLSPTMLPVREVWAMNLDSEMAYLRELVECYNCLAMNIKFPGVVARPIGSFETGSDYYYQTLPSKLSRLGISYKVDDSSAAIGRRYSRNDELGTPFGITVDFQTVNDGSLTLRERDTTKQIRASEEEILGVIKELLEGLVSWEDVLKSFPNSFVGKLINHLYYSSELLSSITIVGISASEKLFDSSVSMFSIIVFVTLFSSFTSSVEN